MTAATDKFIPHIGIVRTTNGLGYIVNAPVDPDSEIPYDVAGRPGRQEIHELYRKLQDIPGVDQIYIGVETVNVTTRGHYCVEDAVHPHILRILREHFGWYGYVEGSTEIHYQ